MSRTHKRLFVVIAILVVMLLSLSALYWLGMRHLEGKPRTFLQSLQWAAGTTSTTGYSPDTTWHHPAMIALVVLSQFAGVTIIFMVLPIVLLPLLESRFETRLPVAIESRRDHVVIFRYGPTVATLINDLAQARVASVVIEEEEAAARHLVALGRPVLHGNLEEGVLARAHLLNARALVVNGTDERNAAATLVARQLGFKGEIVALVEDPFHRHPMLLAGATAAYTPRHVLGAALAARASGRISPTVAGIQHLGHRLQVAEVRISRDSPLAGRTLAEVKLYRHAGVSIVGQWVAGRLTAPAAPDMRLEPGGILVLVGSDDGIRQFMHLCEGARRLRREGPFVIAGGGEVGRKVAQLLRDAGERTFLIDIKPGPEVDLVGNVVDTHVLRQARLEQAQAVVLALSADAMTLFSAVIIKDLVPELPIIARVNSAENIDRIYLAGADFALSISQVSGQMLLMKLLGKEVVSVNPELQVVRVSGQGLAGVHPRDADIHAQTGCSLVAVEREGALQVEFEAEFELRAEDRVYVCGDAQSVRRFLDRYGVDQAPAGFTAGDQAYPGAPA